MLVVDWRRRGRAGVRAVGTHGGTVAATDGRAAAVWQWHSVDGTERAGGGRGHAGLESRGRRGGRRRRQRAWQLAEPDSELQPTSLPTSRHADLCHLVTPSSSWPMPVEHQLQCIPQASMGQATEQAMGSRMANCLHLRASLHYLRWLEYESVTFLTL